MLFEIGTGSRTVGVSHQAFLAKAATLSQGLPAAGHLLNLCNNRYLFALAFAAALMRGAVSLFPPSRLAATCNGIARDYPDAVCLSDTPLDGLTLPLHLIGEPADHGARPPSMPTLVAERPALVAFTPGSSSRLRPHVKHWGDLVGCALAAARRFGLDAGLSVVATVPPQHMYGLELSILVPFTLGAPVSAVRPFFPADICAALARMPRPRLLVTTPVHLAACVEAGLRWPRLELIISAAAPLPQTLARQAEARLSARLCEIYGTTETGAIASRCPSRDPRWRWYDGVRAHQDDAGRVSVTADFIHGRVPLADRLALDGDDGFRLVAPAPDLIKVGGKRASLAGLNRVLKAIDGVIDGVFVPPEPGTDPVGRLAVIVVAPGLDRDAIIHALRDRIDPILHPRRVLFVERLPYTRTGTLPREALLALLAANSIQTPNAN
jgi:acyl-coenzyme A synthetase/AMP-(fatty) acid ligase